MTRRLFLAVVLAVLGGLLLAAGAPGQLAAPGLTALEPDTIIDSGPPNPSSSSTATFTFHSDDLLATFECSRDGAAFTNCSSGKTYNGLPDGPHTFQVRAINALSEVDSSPAPYGWTISTDSVAPDTTITSTPIGTTSSTSATFTFDSTEAGSTFECRRDAQAFSPCPSSKTYNGLAIGTHTFYVRATDASDNTDASPDSETWTVVSADSAPPDTTITSAPIGTTSSTSATFTFTSTEAGSTFECRRDAQVFGPCPASKTYNGLSLGSHTFYVRATDPSDNTDASPASETWTVAPADPVPPETTITSGPIGTTPSTSATFEFTSSEGGSTFECRRNLSAFIPCSSPITYSALADGTHTFEVRATDPSDNVDATPASATWTVASNTTGVPTVGNLRAIAGDHRVRLVWTNPAGIGIRRIEIRRGINRLLVYTGRGTEFVDTRVFNSRRYTYSVLVVDDLGQRSPAAGIFALPRGKLRAPRDGRPVLRPPMLRWLPRARATYYNIQVYRNGKKILSRWPARTRFQLRIQWRYQDRTYRLRDGRYVWYVFPKPGKRADNRYGREWGHSLFVKR